MLADKLLEHVGQNEQHETSDDRHEATARRTTCGDVRGYECEQRGEPRDDDGEIVEREQMDRRGMRIAHLEVRIEIETGDGDPGRQRETVDETCCSRRPV